MLHHGTKSRYTCRQVCDNPTTPASSACVTFLLLPARTWITSQPWHQQHPTARNTIKQAFWRNMKLVSQTLSAIFYRVDFLTEWTKTFSIFEQWEELKSLYFHHHWKKSLTGPEVFMTGSRSRSWSYCLNFLPKTLCRVVCGMNMVPFKKWDTKTVIKAEGRAQIN